MYVPVLSQTDDRLRFDSVNQSHYEYYRARPGSRNFTLT